MIANDNCHMTVWFCDVFYWVKNMMTVADWYAADSYAAECSWIEEKFPSPRVQKSEEAPTAYCGFRLS